MNAEMGWDRHIQSPFEMSGYLSFTLDPTMRRETKFKEMTKKALCNSFLRSNQAEQNENQQVS